MYTAGMKSKAASRNTTAGACRGVEMMVEAWVRGGGAARHALYEFIRFGVYMAWACMFGGILLVLLLGTYLWYPDVLRDAGVARYDFLFVCAFCVQVGLIYFRLETKEEAVVIGVFHIVGTVMEVFKTYMGSWVYPEYAFFRIGGVPLFTGFMYAAVGSYIARGSRICDFRFTSYPVWWHAALLAVLMYINFFTHHFFVDVRYVLFGALLGVYGRTWIHFKVWEVYRRMPLVLGFFLTACFIWFAENVGTFAGAWVYPNQVDGWHMVSFAKLGSWLMLVVISFVLVMSVKRAR
jgi:uncharacterized membrane protein YoaT (DUF817 family)